MNLIQFFGSLELGLIYSLVAIGVFISFRVLDFPDLTVDGSFPMGAAIAGILIVEGFNPWLATAIAMMGGAMAGTVIVEVQRRTAEFYAICFGKYDIGRDDIGIGRFIQILYTTFLSNKGRALILEYLSASSVIPVCM